MRFDRNLLFTIFVWFPFADFFVLCHAKSRDNAGIWNFAISDEIFHVLDFLQMETSSVLYYTYVYDRNPKSMYCEFPDFWVMVVLLLRTRVLLY